jgi:hypothetical protein
MKRSDRVQRTLLLQQVLDLGNRVLVKAISCFTISQRCYLRAAVSCWRVRRYELTFIQPSSNNCFFLLSRALTHQTQVGISRTTFYRLTRRLVGSKTSVTRLKYDAIQQLLDPSEPLTNGLNGSLFKPTHASVTNARFLDALNRTSSPCPSEHEPMNLAHRICSAQRGQETILLSPAASNADQSNLISAPCPCSRRNDSDLPGLTTASFSLLPPRLKNHFMSMMHQVTKDHVG